MLGHYPYLTNSDIEEIYRKIKASRKGITAFKKDAQAISSKLPEDNGYRIVYKDEEALFKVFQKHLSKELTGLGIDCFGRLMQYIS